MAGARRGKSRGGPRGSGGGPGGALKQVLWAFVTACVAVAVFGGAATDPRGFYDSLVRQSASLEAWVGDLVSQWPPSADSLAPGPDGGGSADGSPAAAQLAGLVVADDRQVAYDRDQWRHWDNVGSSCWNVREQVLVRDATPGSVTLLDRDKQPTTDLAAACYVTGGTWVDPYTGATFTNPDDLDIDHVVPLGDAARSGGQDWSADRKRDYANDLTDPGHLLAVSASANRAKGDQTPDQWRPANQAFWCSYATDWVGVKSTWGLTVTTAESAALQDMLATC